MEVNYHILKNTIVINYEGKCFKIDRVSKLGNKVLSLIKDNKLEEIPDVVDIEVNIAKYAKDKFIIVDGDIYSYGVKVHQYIAEKIIEFNDEGIPFDYLLNFWNNVQMNPSEVSRNDLYRFLEAGEYPLTPDGYIVAYKRITSNYLDVWTRTIDNSIGAKPSMNREDVCADNTITCAPGLHVASFDYAKDFYYGGDKKLNLIEVKVHPKDVVSVPYDYNFSKMRTCGYEVINNVEEAHDKIILTGSEYVSEEYFPTVAAYESDNVEEECDEDLVECASCSPEADMYSMYNAEKVRLGNLDYNVLAIKNVGTDQLFEQYLTDIDYVRQKPSRFPKGIKYYHQNLTLVTLYRVLEDYKYIYAGIYKDLVSDEFVYLRWHIV